MRTPSDIYRARLDRYSKLVERCLCERISSCGVAVKCRVVVVVGWIVVLVLEIVVESLKRHSIPKPENFPKTQDKSPISVLRLLFSYTSTKVTSGVSSKGRSFSLWQIRRRHLALVKS